MENRNNIIAGWALAAGIVALGGSILFGKMFHGEVPKEGKQGYVIQGVEDTTGGGAVAAIPVATLLASGDVAKGKEVFGKCASCHTIVPGGANGIGPNLHGVLGKPHGAHAGFAYSEALKGVKGNWSFESMNEWLTNPKKYAPGNKMTYQGLSKAEDRANLLLYINSQGSNLPLPAPPAEGAAPAAAEGADAAKADPAKAGAPAASAATTEEAKK
jgi:cytochrome c